MVPRVFLLGLQSFLLWVWLALPDTAIQAAPKSPRKSYCLSWGQSPQSLLPGRTFQGPPRRLGKSQTSLWVKLILHYALAAIIIIAAILAFYLSFLLASLLLICFIKGHWLSPKCIVMHNCIGCFFFFPVIFQDAYVLYFTCEFSVYFVLMLSFVPYLPSLLASTGHFVANAEFCPRKWKLVGKDGCGSFAV